ncbi:MAG: peptidase inactive domain protein [Bacteroidetes bacterium]|nr:peptidase inactive domain protein [Bacteroidota bacterium]
MKKIYLFVAAFVIAMCSSFAQQQQMPPIPVDKDVRIGKLDNGLTYYIRKNNLPENQANFYIVQKVGSMQEEENQRGLAHFLEHMAFNGSKNFPNDSKGKGIIPYLETVGVKYGQNLNAGTSFDYTVYNIDAVPTGRQDVLDSCLLILHDWSGFLLLREIDIDKERKVIHEEWRTRQNMSMRMLGTLLPEIYKGSKYADRMPIGKMEVIDNFEPKVLRDYYQEWYRPDLQGIIIVGDVDVDKTEQKIKDMFADTKKPVNPAERVYSQVPDNDEPIVSVATDKENPNTNILVFYKRDIIPSDKKMNMDYLVYDFMNSMIEQMLSNRLQEMIQKENPPFAFAEASSGSYLISKTKDAMQFFAISNPNASNLAIETIIREANRAKEFGFTAGEYERAKADYISKLEKLYNERDKQRSSYFIDQYTNNFLENEPIPSIADKYNTIQQMANFIPLEAINQLVKGMITDKNRVVAIMGTEKENYSPEADIKALIKKVDSEKITAYVDNAITEPLMATMPAKGKIVNEEQNQGATVWTLSNGAKVVVKPTKFKDDEVLLSGYAPGGSSVIDNKYISEIKVLGKIFESIMGESALSAGGLGKFSKTDLTKVLSGKNVSMNFSIDNYNENISGKSNVKDIETAMQLLYLNFTDVRKDQPAYTSFATRAKGMLTNFGSNPMIAFSDSILTSMYKNNPRGRFISAKDVESADYDILLKLRKERFANAGNFIFTIVGNVMPEELKPLVEQYIASLPSTPEKSTFNAKVMPQRKGKFNNNFIRALEIPKATTGLIYSGKLKYNLQNEIQLDALKQILDIVLTDKIREKLGGTYGVQISSELEKTPEDGFSIQLMFDTDPDRRTELVKAIDQTISEMQKTGPSAENVQKVKEFMTKQHADELKKNEYMLNTLNNQYRFGVDFVTSYEQYVDNLSINSLKKFARNLFAQGNRIEVSMSSGK